MNPHPLPSAAPRPSIHGFTLVEMLVAVAASVLLIGSIWSLTIFTSDSFHMVGNYVDLDAQSRNSVDVLGRQIRDASALLNFSTNNPPYLELTNQTTLATIYVGYNSSKGTLMMTNIQAGTTIVTMLLTNCNQWSFALYDRAPNTSTLTFYSATNSSGQLAASACKVINMTWQCSRTLLGAKLNTESVQTAEIILRNKVN